MNNIFGTQLILSLVITAGAFGLVAAFVYLKFPNNVIAAASAVAVIAASAYLMHRREKKARFDIYYTTVQEFGTPLNFGNTDAAFERDGTRFDIDFPQGENSQFFKVVFYIPNFHQKFSVQNRTLLSRYEADCKVIQDSVLPQEYIVQARNPEFLQKLLYNSRIRDEILIYNASFWGQIMIAFNDGSFEMIWTPPVSENITGFYQVCQSAVVFHDELKRISKLPR